MKSNRSGLPKALCRLFLIIIIASNGGGGGGTTTTDTTTDGGGDGDTGGDGGTTPPVFSGFDFTLSEGDFWDYSWDYSKAYWDSFSGGSTTEDSGTFRVTLGSAKVIEGVTAYEVKVTGKSQVDSLNLAPRWDYLAISENKLLGSEDGTTLTTIFDAQEGTWPGSGFFASFSSEDLFTATEGNINNDYISGPAISVGQSSSSSQCEYFPGVGTICGGDYNENDIKKEYYKENIGPLGYYSYFSISDMTSYYPWSSSTTINLGMVSSSLSGDTANYDFEAEPNDSPAAAQAMTPSRDIHGYCGDEDGGTDIPPVPEAEPNDTQTGTVGEAAQSLSLNTVVSGNTDLGDSYTSVTFSSRGSPYTIGIEDCYSLTLGSSTTVKTELDYQGSPEGARIALFIFNNTGTNTLGDAIAFDLSEDTTKSFTFVYGAGTYLIAVVVHDESTAQADYTLQVSKASESDFEIEDWYSFSLDSQAAVTITLDIANTSADLDLYLYDENGATLLESSIAGGAQESITKTIGPGTYIIGVDAFNGSSNYTLELETS
jgi:hypothetical protein